MSCPPAVDTAVLMIQKKKADIGLQMKISIPTNLAVVIWAVYRHMSSWPAGAAYMTME